LTVLAEEEHLPYDRVALSKALSGQIDLTLGDPALWQNPRVRLLTGEPASEIDLEARLVRTATTEVPFDDVVLATGSNAARLSIPGAEHTHVYRTLDDVTTLTAEVRRLAATLGRAPRAVVIGGGLLGLEAAGGLQGLGAEAAVVNVGPWLMNAQLDEGAGQALGRLITATGITVHCGVVPTAIRVGEGGVVDGV